jgi:hypothetical protein
MTPAEITALIAVPIPVILGIISFVSERLKAKDEKEKDAEDDETPAIVVPQGIPIAPPMDRADEMTRTLITELRKQIRDRDKEIDRLRDYLAKHGHEWV